MKKRLFLLAFSVFIFLTSCKKEEQFPEMSFQEKEYNFGIIKKDSQVEHTFEFKNSGTIDLVISNARGSCGCTVPEFPKKAIKPGEKGEIKVSFNSKGKKGQNRKSITIFSNTKNGTDKIFIRASVEMSAKDSIGYKKAKKIFKNLK